MNNLGKILLPDNVLLNLDASSKEIIFNHIGLMFENNCGISHELVAESLLARENLGSTGLGHGVAVPHGRIQGLKQPVAAFARLATPIPFGSPDGNPVALLIFLLIPDNVTQKHLEILSEIAEMFSSSDFRASLTNEMDKTAVYNMITTWQPSHLKNV